MMGPGIAGALAYGGLRTVILSRNATSAAEGLQKALQQIDLLESHGLMEPARAANARDLLSSSADFEGVIPTVDIVIESAPENMAFKQDLFARMDALARPDAVLATNTSGLSVTDIASKCTRPERVME